MAEDPSDPHPDPHPHAHTPSDHPLNGMESFFDNLFNQHMVLPQTPEDLRPIEGPDQEAVHDGEGAGPTGGAG